MADWVAQMRAELDASPLEGLDRLRLIYELHAKYAPPEVKNRYKQFDQQERRLLMGIPIVEVEGFSDGWF